MIREARSQSNGRRPTHWQTVRAIRLPPPGSANHRPLGLDEGCYACPLEMIEEALVHPRAVLLFGVLMHLSDYWRKPVAESDAELASKFERTTRAVARYLSQLEQAGYIAIRRGPSGRAIELIWKPGGMDTAGGAP